jgi:hypothetical protein
VNRAARAGTTAGASGRIFLVWRTRGRIQSLVALLAGSGDTLPREPYVRDKFTLERSHARKRAKDYFAQYPKDLFETEVESWRDLQSYNIEFTMKRLREPKARGNANG